MSFGSQSFTEVGPRALGKARCCSLDGRQKFEGPERKLRAFDSSNGGVHHDHASRLRTNFLLARRGEANGRGRAAMRTVQGDLRRLFSL